MGDQAENDPKLKLFLRLPRDTFSPSPEDEEMLKTELFRLLGDTTADRFMPRISKGHCFLFFESRLLAAQAHDKLSNKVVKDYPLQPVFGFTRDEQQAVDAGLQNKEIERNHRTLYIRGLPQGVNGGELEGRFSQFGEIEKTNVVATKASQVAFLVFRKFAPAHEAIEAYVGGLEMNGVTATVELSKNKNLRRRVEKFQQGGGMGGGRGGGFGGPRGGFGNRGRGWGGGFSRGGYGGGHQQTPWGAPQWGSQNQYGAGRGRGGRGGYGSRGGYGAQRGAPSRGAYGSRGGGYGARGGGYGARGGASAGGAYGGGRGGGAYGGGRGGGYGAPQRGGWGSQNRGGTQRGGMGGGNSWGSKAYTPY